MSTKKIKRGHLRKTQREAKNSHSPQVKGMRGQIMIAEASVLSWIHHKFLQCDILVTSSFKNPFQEPGSQHVLVIRARGKQRTNSITVILRYAVNSRLAWAAADLPKKNKSAHTLEGLQLSSPLRTVLFCLVQLGWGLVLLKICSRSFSKQWLY